MAVETYKPNPLRIGDFPAVSHVFSLTGSGTAKAGTPIKSADGIAGEVAQASADAATVVAILPFDVELSATPQDVSCHVSGEYSDNAVVLEDTMTLAELNASLRQRCVPIFVR